MNYLGQIAVGGNRNQIPVYPCLHACPCEFHAIPSGIRLPQAIGFGSKNFSRSNGYHQSFITHSNTVLPAKVQGFFLSDVWGNWAFEQHRRMLGINPSSRRAFHSFDKARLFIDKFHEVNGFLCGSAIKCLSLGSENRRLFRSGKHPISPTTKDDSIGMGKVPSCISRLEHGLTSPDNKRSIHRL